MANGLPMLRITDASHDEIIGNSVAVSDTMMRYYRARVVSSREDRDTLMTQVVHRAFATTSERGLRHDILPMRLYHKAKKLGVWDPQSKRWNNSTSYPRRPRKEYNVKEGGCWR